MLAFLLHSCSSIKHHQIIEMCHILISYLGMVHNAHANVCTQVWQDQSNIHPSQSIYSNECTNVCWIGGTDQKRNC